MTKLVLTVIIGVGATLMLNGCSSEISGVKDGVLPAFSNSLTVGQALDGWTAQECTDKNWELITTERGEKTVQFTCEVDVSELKRPEDMAEGISDSNHEKAIANLKTAEKTKEKAIDNYIEIEKHIITYGDPDYINAEAENQKTAIAKENAEKAVHDMLVHLARKKMESRKFILQFTISADEKSFEPNYEGIEYTFEDGKTYSEDFSFGNFILGAAYRNQKSEPEITADIYKDRK